MAEKSSVKKITGAPSKIKPTNHKIIICQNALKVLNKLLVWATKNARELSIFGGSAVVALWTLIRHISNGVNFDVVGQIGVAQQWANGQMSGTQLGATSYLIKIPFYFMINALSFLTPMTRILLMALLFNIATFIVLFILFEKILKLYRVKKRTWLYLGMAWLATIAGNVFWVDYANSRNLETAGGILFIYLILKYLRYNHQRQVAWIVLAGAVVFFADPIQFYICGIGASLFVSERWLINHSRKRLIQAINVLSATTLGYLISEGLLRLAKLILHVSFLATPNNHSALKLSNLIAIFRGIGGSTLKIFGADFFKRTYSFNSGRELLNALVLIGLVIAIIKILRRSKKNTAVWLLFTLIITNYLIYIASGQVLEWQTARYLIMVPLFAVLILAVGGDNLFHKNSRLIQGVWLFVILICFVMLVGALLKSWPDKHSKDKRIYTLVTFMNARNYGYALSSRDAGITTTYFSTGKRTILPVACQPNGTIQPTNLFFDNSAFNGLARYHQDIPVIVPEGGINFGPNTCTKANMIAQFGYPKLVLPISGFGSALVYQADSLQIMNYKFVSNSQISKVKPRFTSFKPQTLPSLSNCDAGRLEIIVAHPDDDLLFMNPDLADAIRTRCVRTIYVTSGDDGRPPDYWMRREGGIEAAYATMINLPNIWNNKFVILDNHAVTIRTLNGYPSASLVYIHLPDGSPSGQGFPSTGYSSLKKMSANRNLTISTIDGSSRYNYLNLTKLISKIITIDKPDQIFTTIPGGRLSFGDHSDHRQVGKLAINARDLAKSYALLTEYVGYPLNKLPENLTLDEASQKKAIFDIYAAQDDAICKTFELCYINNSFGSYFSRTYKLDQNLNNPNNL